MPRDVAVASVEVLHREVHAVELASGHGQVARHARADGEHDRVEALAQLRGVDVAADVDAEAKLDALLGELREAPLDDVLLDLEVGDAEAEQAAAGFVALEHGHRVTGAVQLLRARETRRPRADDRDACARCARAGGSATIQPSSHARVDDRELDLLDRDGVALLDLEHARGFARRGAEAAGELGEVVRAVQLVDRLAEPVAVHEVVPVGDEVPERAAVWQNGTPHSMQRAPCSAARRAAARARTRGGRRRARPERARADPRG